jgi:hypothetical protein
MISPSDDANDLLGAQEPRICKFPEYVSSTGVEAIELAALAGLQLDPWQRLVLTHALGERADGRWAAFEVGLVVPRQNGKGGLLEARELTGLFLLGERLLIHSAHEQATSSEHFRRLLNLIESVPEFDRRVLKAPKGKGAESIELRGDQRIFFKTRTAGGGRGLTGDFVALDEAMILPEAMMGALVPTMAARSITGNPQMWLTGSAVDQQKQEHGIVLARARERALRGVDRLVYAEWSIDGDDPDTVSEAVRMSPESWASANPGLGIRISAEHVANEANGALGPREFAVERLGVGDWPSTDGSASRVISQQAWEAGFDPDSRPVGKVAFACDVTPNRSASAIAIAGWRSDGLPHVEIVRHGPGTGWVVTAVRDLLAAHPNVGVAGDDRGPAGSLLSDLTALRLAVTPASSADYAKACSRFFDEVDQGHLRHLLTPELSTAVGGAAKSGGDAWTWSRRSSSVDICPLVAATLALWRLVDDSQAPNVDRTVHFL